MSAGAALAAVLRQAARDASPTALVAGFVAVLVGYTSSVAIVFQAARALGGGPEVAVSWIWALGLGMGLSSVLLSLRYRQPVLTAWSTPGAALLVTAAQGLSLGEATGAFMACGLLITLAGATGLFERVMRRIPAALASALLAGVLARFALQAFGSLSADVILVAPMLLAYLLGRRLWPRYAVPGVLLAGVLVALLRGQLGAAGAGLPELPLWGWPHFTAPTLSLPALAGVALPLFLVTMGSQNLPGVMAQRACGYATPVSPVITATGLFTLVLAPFGAFALNLAAITAAICMGREAHEDPARRYVAAVAAGVFYLLTALLAGAVVAGLALFPPTLVMALAGFALLGTIGEGLAGALRDTATREAALITFLVTASGLTLWGVGSALWGIVLGALALVLLRRPSAQAPRPPQEEMP